MLRNEQKAGTSARQIGSTAYISSVIVSKADSLLVTSDKRASGSFYLSLTLTHSHALEHARVPNERERDRRGYRLQEGSE